MKQPWEAAQAAAEPGEPVRPAFDGIVISPSDMDDAQHMLRREAGLALGRFWASELWSPDRRHADR